MVTIPLDCNAIISEWMLALLSNLILYMQHHSHVLHPHFKMIKVSWGFESASYL